METPNYNHIFRNRTYQEHVYEPSEDTFILLDALEKQLLPPHSQTDSTGETDRRQQPLLCCEIGTGNGVPGVFLNKLLSKVQTVAPFVVMTDINPHAIECAQETVSTNEVLHNSAVMRSSLFGAFRSSLKFDIVLFNPPYVVTEDASVANAQSDASIYAALDGGTAGLRITELFMKELPEKLSANGCCYLVAIRENDPTGMLAELAGRHKLRSEIVIDRRAGIEHLYVLKLQHTN